MPHLHNYVALFAATGIALSGARAQGAPRHVLFTWRGDTGTTLLVHYQTSGPKALASRVYWDTAPRGGIVEDYRFRTEGEARRIPGLEDRWVHHVELTGLQPGAAIHLCAGDPARGISREYGVRTIPAGARPLRFCTGGDMGPGADTRVLLRQAASRAPDFALLGGDIAYANGRVENVDHWDSWLTYWSEEMVRPDGFSIPVVVAIGNHEVDGGYAQPKERAPFYFGFFAQDERSYFTRRFGSELVVFVLDSGHIAEHGGAQAEWLEAQLRQHQDLRHRVALYHVPLYPSHRAFDGRLSQQGREHWAPRFDRHGLHIAFENHDHTWKRSQPLRQGRIDPDGVLYLGDGCFGRPPRAVLLEGRWYLSRQATIPHFWLVDVDPSGMVCRAIDRRGREFDVHPEDAPGAATAAEVFASLATRYALPPGSVTVAPLPDDGGRPGTRTTVQVQNPFDAPIEVELLPGRGLQSVRPGAVLAPAIAPGAAATIPIELVASPRATDRFSLQVRLRVRDGRLARDEIGGEVPIPSAGAQRRD